MMQAPQREDKLQLRRTINITRMAPLEFTKQQLRKSNSAVIEFATTHIYKNEVTGLEIDRYDVVIM